MLGVGIPNVFPVFVIGMIIFCLFTAALLKASASALRYLGAKYVISRKITYLCLYIIAAFVGLLIVDGALLFSFATEEASAWPLWIAQAINVAALWAISWFLLIDKSYRTQFVANSLGLSFLITTLTYGVLAIIVLLISSWLSSK